MRNKSIVLCALLAMATALFHNETLGQLKVNYWESITMGPYAVGHEKMLTIDPSRTYDFTLGDSTVEMQNKPAGRPILLNIYYPVKTSKGGKKISIRDLWQFSGDHSIQHFLKSFENYEYEMAKMYAMDENLSVTDCGGDTSKHTALLSTIMKDYASQVLYAKDGLEPLNDHLPVIIYHQGLGGTFDENILLLEYLASNGFLVLSSSFVNSVSSWSLGVGDTDASLQDIDFIVDLVKSKLSKSKQLFLTGHSFGANTIFSYPVIGKHQVTGIAPLDSDYGYGYYYHMQKSQQPDLKKQTNYVGLPIFAAGRSEAHFRMIDLLDKSQRHFLKINNFKHNDFCAQTIIGAAHCYPYVKDKEHIEWITGCYSEFCAQLLIFFLSTTENMEKAIAFKKTDATKMTIESFPAGKRSAVNSIFQTGQGKCPSNSQLLTLIETEGMQVAGNEWLNCGQVQDTSYFDFDWLSIYEALLTDTSSARAINFLDWYIKNRSMNKRMIGYAYLTYEIAFTDNGDGFHFYKANDVFRWMTNNLPNEIEGHKGLIMCKRVEEYHAAEEDKEKLKGELKSACTAFLARYPDYYNLPIDNQWDETIQSIIRKNSDSK